MWRGKFDHCVTPIEFDLDWLTGIYFCQDGRKYAVLSVYLPFECPVKEETYLEKLGVLQAILSELDTSCVSILGDWNADISDVNEGPSSRCPLGAATTAPALLHLNHCKLDLL